MPIIGPLSDYDSVLVRPPVRGVVRGEMGFAPEGIGDEFAVAPSAMYGMRKLRVTYSGACIRLRNDDTDAELDIGFDMDGALDTATAATHLGASLGRIVTWYDQSLNGNHLTQATADDQPEYDPIGMDGTLPAAFFDRITSTNGYFLATPDAASLDFEGDMTMAMVLSFEAVNVGRQDIMQKGGNGSTQGEFAYWIANNTAKPAVDRPFIEAGVGATNGMTVLGQTYVAAFTINSTTVSHFLDGAANGTDTLAVGAAAANHFRIGAGHFAGASGQEDPMRGWIAELIIWESLTDADRQLAEDSMGAYYSVTIS